MKKMKVKKPEMMTGEGDEPMKASKMGYKHGGHVHMHKSAHDGHKHMAESMKHGHKPMHKV